MSGLLGNNIITQIGILVNDIEKVRDAYAAFFSIEKPPIVITDPVDKALTTLNGVSTEARAKLVFFNMGSLQLELIEPDQHPSTWRNHLDEHGEGPHHIAFLIEGMQEKIELLSLNGFKLQQKGEYEGGRYAYIDTFNELKVLIELLENDKK